MNNINSLKRYQIAKVYRKDNHPSEGRYREFYQCDFDIAGQCEVMEADFEVVKVLTELLDKVLTELLDELNIGDYEIKLNHRKLLDSMLQICGVSSEKFRTVCSSIEKLDKQSFDQVKKELVIRATETQVLVAILGKDLQLASELVSELWNAKVKAEFALNKRVRNHIDRAVKSGIPWVVFVGESELNSGIVKLKNIESHQEEMIPRERFAEELQKRLNIVCERCGSLI